MQAQAKERAALAPSFHIRKTAAALLSLVVNLELQSARLHLFVLMPMRV